MWRVEKHLHFSRKIFGMASDFFGILCQLVSDEVLWLLSIRRSGWLLIMFEVKCYGVFENGNLWSTLAVDYNGDFVGVLSFWLQGNFFARVVLFIKPLCPGCWLEGNLFFFMNHSNEIRYYFLIPHSSLMTPCCIMVCIGIQILVSLRFATWIYF